MAERYEHIIRTAMEGDVESHRKLQALAQDLFQIGNNASASTQQIAALRKVAADLSKVEIHRAAQGRLNATAGPASFTSNLSEFLAGRQTNRPVSLLARLGAATQGQRISDEGMVRQVGLPVAVKAMFAMMMAKTAINGLTTLSQEGGNLKAIGANFNMISGGANEAKKRLEKFNEVLNGTVADSTVQKGVAQLNTAGVKGTDGKAVADKDVAALFKGVTQLGHIAGYKTDDSMKRLLESIQTGHSSELEKILPGFNPEAAKSRFMENSGLTAEEIKSAPGLEQSIAMQEAQRALQEALSHTSAEALSAGDAAAQLQAQIQNAKNAVIEGVGGSKEFTEAVKKATSAIQAATPTVVSGLKTALAAASTETGAGLVKAGAFAAAGAKLGSAFGPEGAAIGAAAGAAGSLAYDAGSWAADSGSAAIRKREGKFAEQFAEPAGFDQASYDKKQAAFVDKLAGMSDSEFQSFKGSTEYRSAQESGDSSAAELAKQAPLLVGMTGSLMHSVDNLATAMLGLTAKIATPGALLTDSAMAVFGGGNSSRNVK